MMPTVTVSSLLILAYMAKSYAVVQERRDGSSKLFIWLFLLFFFCCFFCLFFFCFETGDSGR